MRWPRLDGPLYFYQPIHDTSMNPMLRAYSLFQSPALPLRGFHDFHRHLPSKQSPSLCVFQHGSTGCANRWLEAFL